MQSNRMLLWIVLCLAVPIVPFLALGGGFEAAAARLLEAGESPLAVGALAVGLLASDILLPIPSSTVCTVAAYRLGLLPGILVSFLGLTFGSVAAFAAARFLGRRFVRKRLSEGDAESMQAKTDRWGVFLVVLARPVPILAEASVLWLGTTALSWKRFLSALALANLAIAAVYGILGTTVPPFAAVVISAVAPLGLLAGVRWFEAQP